MRSKINRIPPVLSILIISHNQKELLRRCIESVLQQDLPFEHEIIISDDASTDGTWELAKEYATKYNEINAYRCNSNDCCPTYVAERAGFNRCNAYQHSLGKYFCHIDADDYYRPGTDCLKRMVELLDNHLNCSICMQNGWIVKDGDPLENGSDYYPIHSFSTGEILKPKQYYSCGFFVNNGAMMMRRYHCDNPAFHYHKFYDDSVITNHHLQYGNIVCIDCSDWIYTKSNLSATSSLKHYEQIVVWNLDLTVFSAMMVPKFTQYYYTKDNISGLKLVIRTILHRASLSKNVIAFCKQFDTVFIYRAAAKNTLNLYDRLRLHICLVYSILLTRFNLTSSYAVLLLNKLCGA